MDKDEEFGLVEVEGIKVEIFLICYKDVVMVVVEVLMKIYYFNC